MNARIWIAIVAVWAAAGWCSGIAADVEPPFGGEWEVTVRRDVPKKEKTKPEADGHEASVVPETEVVLRIRAMVLGFGKESLKIRPTAAPESVLEFLSSQLLAVNRLDIPEAAGEDKPPEGKEKPEGDVLGYTVTLVDGGEFSGKLISFEPKTAVLESVPYGPLSIPTEAIATIEREGESGGDFPTEASVQTAVYLDSGEIFKGELGMDPTEKETLTVQGMLTRAKFPFSAVRRIEFPQGAGSSDSEEERTEFEIGLSDGGRMTCSEVTFEGGFLSMAMQSGVNIRVPIGQVGSIYPVQSGGGISGNGVLLWGGYSDPAEEYDHTLKAVQASGIRTDEIKTGLPGPDFRRMLSRSQAFVVPEMEQLNSGMLNNEVDVGGRKMKLQEYLSGVMRPDLERYWASGGHVIFTGVQDSHFEILKLLGIEGIKTATDKAGEDFKIPPDVQRRLGMKSATLTSANATHAYETPEGWEVFAGQDGKKAAAAISKRIRRGRITLIGADFYESNPSIDELLQKSIRLRR